ncbi:MAG: hypothetical protein HS108_16280 [Planctomycetes bacterium]|nr:hypothetical protein [Planctomycetota bacterium]MCL4729023.1 hypothetical protein [Planctomycetota bacterium]
MHAEQAYLFRHALLRDAAYQLYAPGDLSLLHGMALDLLRELLPPERLPEYATELAWHARAARAGAPDDFTREHLGRVELEYLELAIGHAYGRFRHNDCLAALDKILAHDALPAGQHGLHLCRKADLLLESGRTRQALETAQGALADCRSDPTQVARLLHVIAACHETLSEFAQAEAACLEGLNLPGTNREPLRKLRGVYCMTLTQTGRAELAIRQAQQLLENSENDAERAFALQLLGPILDRARRFDESAAASSQAFALHEHANNLPGQTVTLINLGVLASRRGQTDMARAHYNRALQLARLTGHRRQEALCLNNLAATLPDTPQGCAESEVLYQQALTVTREVGDRRREVFVLNGLTDVCVTTGKLDQARLHSADALQLSRAAVPDQELAARYQAVRIEFHAGHFEAARAALASLMPVLRNENHPARLPHAMKTMAACLERIGDHHGAKEWLAEIQRLSGTVAPEKGKG